MPLDRILSNVISSFIVSCFIRKWIPDSQCGYRLIKTDLLRSIRLCTDHFDTETEILMKAVKEGYKVEFCPVPVIYKDEKSHIHRFVDIFRFLKLLFSMVGYRKGADRSC